MTVLLHGGVPCPADAAYVVLFLSWMSPFWMPIVWRVVEYAQGKVKK